MSADLTDRNGQCRIGQTPQNDVFDAIPQRLPGDLQSVLVGVFYEISGERIYY